MNNLILKGGNTLSTEEVAYFDGKIPTMNQFSICYWEFIEYFSIQAQPAASYCFTNYNDTNVQCLQLWSNRSAEDLGSKVYSNMIDPNQKINNIAKFRKYKWTFINTTLIFLLYSKNE